MVIQTPVVDLLCAGVFVAGKRPWGVETSLDVALPCATQNEVEAADAEALVKAGVKLVCEGANMPSTSEAIEIYHKNGIVFGPAKVCVHTPKQQYTFLIQTGVLHMNEAIEICVWNGVVFGPAKVCICLTATC